MSRIGRVVIYGLQIRAASSGNPHEHSSHSPLPSHGAVARVLAERRPAGSAILPNPGKKMTQVSRKLDKASQSVELRLDSSLTIIILELLAETEAPDQFARYPSEGKPPTDPEPLAQLLKLEVNVANQHREELFGLRLPARSKDRNLQIIVIDSINQVLRLRPDRHEISQLIDEPGSSALWGSTHLNVLGHKFCRKDMHRASVSAGVVVVRSLNDLVHHVRLPVVGLCKYRPFLRFACRDT